MSTYSLFPAKCCRICSAKNENIQNIFETTENGKRVVDMLEFCLQHPIDTSDCFPKFICIKCIPNLIQTYQFFILFKNSEEYFISLYQNLNDTTIDAVTNDIKIESIELPEINEVLIKTEPLKIDFTTTTDLLDEILTPTITTNSTNIQQILPLEESSNGNTDENDKGYQNPLLVPTELFCSGQSSKKVERPRKRTPKQKQFECFGCKDKSFADFKDLAFHMKTHSDHIDRNVTFVFDNVLILDGIKYHVCEVCGKSFSTNVKLYQHRFNVHPSRTNPKKKAYTIVAAGTEPVQRNISERECFMCNLKFSKKSMLDEHLQTHNEEDEKRYMARKNVCSLCGKRYIKCSNLITHMRTHTGDRPFECICGKRFIDGICLKKHMRICSSHTLIPIEKRPLKIFEEKCEFDCKFCNRRFAIKERAQKHAETHTKEDEKIYNQRQYQCDFEGCTKRFREKSFVDRHMLTHTQERPHKCESCNAHYRDVSSLKKHLKKCAPHLIKVKPGGPHKCPYCSTGLFTVHGWLNHKSSHTDLIHSCEYKNCSESFRSASEIQTHVKTVHAHELQNFQCDYDNNCSNSYTLKYMLDAHIDRHKKRTEHLCTECGIVCLRASGLRSHMLTAHSDEKKFACTMCPSKFKQMSRLKVHMVVHSGIKEFKCHCGKQFGHRSALRNHKRIHIGDRKFVCDEVKCRKAFLTSGALKLHTRTHTGERPYKCEYCDKSFTQNGDMKKHMLIHLGPTPNKCTECDASFRLETELRKHSYSHYKPPEN